MRRGANFITRWRVHNFLKKLWAVCEPDPPEKLDAKGVGFRCPACVK
jgi:hypothetical protein